MNNIEQIIGTYKAHEYDIKSPFWNNFVLNIFKKENQIFFTFEMTTEGAVGKIGKVWEGRGFLRADHLALVIDYEIDWIFTSDDNQISEHRTPKNESLPVEIYTVSDSIIVYHKYIDRYIELKKINEQ